MRLVRRAAVYIGLTCATACATLLGVDDVEFRAPADAGDASAERTTGAAPEAGWCDAHALGALFCDDFDTEPAPADGGVPRAWTGIESSYKAPDGGFFPTNGAIGFDTLSQSPPSSLRVSIAADQPDCAYERLDKNIDTTRSFGAIDLAYDLRAGDSKGDLTVAGDMTISDLTAKIDNEAISIKVYLGPQGLVGTFDEYSPGDGGAQPQGGRDSFTPAQLRGTWLRVNVHLDLLASSYTVTFDANRRGTRPLVRPWYRPASRVEVSVGFLCVPKSSTAMELRYDNVTIKSL